MMFGKILVSKGLATEAIFWSARGSSRPSN